MVTAKTLITEKLPGKVKWRKAGHHKTGENKNENESNYHLKNSASDLRESEARTNRAT